MSSLDERPLAKRVAREGHALRTRQRLTQGFVVAAVVLVLLTVGAFTLGDGRWLTFSRTVPFALWLALLGLGFVAFRVVGKRVAAPETLPDVAHGIERERGLRPGALRGALEVADTGPLGARAASDVERLLGRDEILMPGQRRRLTQRVAMGTVAAAVGGALLLVASVRVNDGVAAMLHPLDAWRGLLLPPLAFDSLPAEMPRGMPLTVRVHAPGRSRVVMSVRVEGEAWREDTLPVDVATSHAVLDLGPVRSPMTVRVDDGRAPVLERTVAVGDRGWIGDVQVEAVYPGYLARPSEVLELGGVIRVPRGTELRVQAVAYSGARAVRLARGGDSVEFTNVGASAIAAQLNVNADGEWRWLADATPRDDGTALPVELPPPIRLGMIPDAAPEVVILAPMTDTTIGTSGRLSLAVAARDDHGLAQVALVVRRERADGSRDASSRIVLSGDAQPLWDGVHQLTLDGRSLEAGDKLVVFAQAVDGSPWRQVTDSRRLVLRVPSAEEQRVLARELADSLMSRAAQIADAEKALQRSTSDASRSRELQSGAPSSSGSSQSQPQSPGQKAMSYESAEKMRNIAQQQRDLGSRVDELRDGAKELQQRLSDAGAMDNELAARFNELQKMLREAMTPEMEKQLADLEQASDRLSGNEVRQSLEQLAEQQRQMREQLEKSAEMLKRAALEGAMETLRDEAQELSAEERKLAESLSKQQAGNKAGGQQGEKQGAQSGEQGQQSGENASNQADAKRLADRTKRLEDEVQALTERLRREGAQAGADRTEAAQPQVKSATDAMQEAAKQLGEQQQQQGQQQQGAQQGQPQPGQQGQRQQGQQQQGQQQQGRQQQGQQQQGAQQGQPQPGQQGQQQGGQQQGSPQNAAQQAQRAADAMDQAAQQLAAAREAQVDEWKQDLSQQLDQAINETAQLARQQSQLADRAKDGNAQGMQSEQGAVQQGVQQAAERLEQAGRGSALLSQRSQRAMAEAQQKVQQATQSMSGAGQPGGGEQAQSAAQDAAQALNQALSSLVRDRERVNNSNSASGFGEMLEQMKELAKQQGSLNGQMQGLSMLPGGAQGQQAQQQSRALARQQRGVAEGLQDVADLDPTGRLEALAREAQQVAQSLDRGGPDPSTAERQQQLYRRMLDAGRFLEQDQRDDQGPREARAGDGRGTTRATGPASGRDGVRFTPPTWNDLRGLSADERRLVYEYFRRLNNSPNTSPP